MDYDVQNNPGLARDQQAVLLMQQLNQQRAQMGQAPMWDPQNPNHIEQFKALVDSLGNQPSHSVMPDPSTSAPESAAPSDPFAAMKQQISQGYKSLTKGADRLQQIINAGSPSAPQRQSVPLPIPPYQQSGGPQQMPMGGGAAPQNPNSDMGMALTPELMRLLQIGQ